MELRKKTKQWPLPPTAVTWWEHHRAGDWGGVVAKGIRERERETESERPAAAKCKTLPLEFICSSSSSHSS